MPQNPDAQSRLTALETRVEFVAADADAAAARRLGAAHDRDLADLPMQIEANHMAINALGLQTAGRFDEVDRRFASLEAEMRAGFATSAAGMQLLVDLLTHRDDNGPAPS